jgi:3-oxoadipate enol-lactonase
VPEVTSTDGIVIHYESWGRDDLPPVIMLQGLGADSRGWAVQRLPFGRKFRCLAPDNRGTGKSARPSGPYDLEQMARDVISVLDDAEIDRAHIIGASMGGVLAQIIGVRYPDRVRSLTLACTACRHHAWRRELLEEWMHAVEVGGMSALSDDALRWLIGPRLRKRVGVWLNLLARIVLQGPPEPFVSQVQGILAMSDELRYELARITVPTLVITGSQDALTPVGDAEEIHELIPHSEMVVLGGAAHGLMVEAPNAFNDTVISFITRVVAEEQVLGADTTSNRESGNAETA